MVSAAAGWKLFRADDAAVRKGQRVFVMVDATGAAQAGAASLVCCGVLRSMKSRESLIRAKRFQTEDARRRLAQIDTMIAEFDRMAAELDRDVAAEEARSGISDPRHFAYPPLAAAARQRRVNLAQSAQELRQQRDEAHDAFREAEAQLQLAEAAGERERASEAMERRGTWRQGEPARL